MSLLKVYVGKNNSDCVFEINKDFKDNDLDFIYKTSMSDIFQNNKPTLLSNYNSKTKVYLGCENKGEFSDKSIDWSSMFKKKSILVFSTLPKNTKLFKSLSLISSIEKIESLIKHKDKKKFIQSIFKEFNISNNYLNDFILCSPESRYGIYTEARKLSVAIGILDNPLKVLSSNSATYDIFSFLDHLFRRDLAKTLFFYNRSKSDVNSIKLCHILSSYFMCLLLLEEGNSKHATKFWNVPKWNIRDKELLSKKIGRSNLFKYHSRIDTDLLNFYNQKPTDYKIRQFIQDFCLSS